MADKRISELNTITGANTADDDLFVIVDSSAGETKSITRSELGQSFDLVSITADSSNQTLLELKHPISPDDAGGYLALNTDGTTDDNVVTFGIKYSSIDYDVLNIQRSTQNVGIGTSIPGAKLEVSDTDGEIRITGTRGTDTTHRIHTGGTNSQAFNITSGSTSGNAIYHNSTSHIFRNQTGATEYGRIDSSGNLLVNTTNTAPGVANTATGHSINSAGYAAHSRSGGACLLLNRNSSDSQIANFRKDGLEIGSIGVEFSDNLFIKGNASHAGIGIGTTSIYPSEGDGTSVNNVYDLGSAASNFKDLYLSGGVVFGTTGGDVTSKTLNDYEEGTWTPGFSGTFLEGAFASATGFGGTVSARYVRIGQVCHCWAEIPTITGASGNLVGDDNFGITYSSLPFTVEPSSTLKHASGMITAYESVGAGENANGPIIFLNATNEAVCQITAISNTVSATNAYYQIWMSYRID